MPQTSTEYTKARKACLGFLTQYRGKGTLRDTGIAFDHEKDLYVIKAFVRNVRTGRKELVKVYETVPVVIEKARYK